MKRIIITFLVSAMLTINVSAGTDGENKLSKKPKPTKDEIREAMHGNICRCASYNRIEKAVKLAAKNS